MSQDGWRLPRPRRGGKRAGNGGSFPDDWRGAAATVISVRQRPADHRHRQHQQQHPRADKTQGSPVAKQMVARFGINAEKNGNEQHDAPCQHDRNAWVPADHRKEFPGRLARRNPPGQQRRYASRQRERQQLAREPALDLRPGFFPHEIVPDQQPYGQGYPAIHGRPLVKPVPSPKQHSPVARHRQPRQQEQAQNRVAQHGHKNGHQTHELEPVPRRHSFASSAHGLFGQEVQSTAVAIHGCSPTVRDSNQRSPSAYCVCRSKNYWSEGQFWYRSLFLHKSSICSREQSSAFRYVSARSARAARAHRNQEAGAPALRPSSCSSSSCFCRSALRFSKSFNWPFLSLMYAMLSFIPVVTSKPPLPYFLMSSFILAIASSTAAIWPRTSCARPRQYSSLFSPPSPSGPVGRARRAPFFGASPTDRKS